MGTSRLSTFGLQLTNLRVLSSGQSSLSKLSTQLATQKQSEDLADYTTSEAHRILNITGEITTKNSYLATINTVDSRVKSYDTTLTSIEDLTSTLSTALTSAQSYNSSNNATITEQVSSTLTNVLGLLNTEVDGNYLFSGSRFNTAPTISDWSTLSVPPTETVVTNTALPVYDTDYPGTALQITKAWNQNQISIDTSQSLTYGVTSTQTGFQQLVLGLRWAYAATQDPTNYSTYMATARNLISTGYSAIQAIHTGVSNSSATLETTKSNLETTVSNLHSSLDDIQGVDTNEVGVKITSFQSVLEASYSAIGILAKLNILNYL